MRKKIWIRTTALFLSVVMLSAPFLVSCTKNGEGTVGSSENSEGTSDPSSVTTTVATDSHSPDTHPTQGTFDPAATYLSADYSTVSGETVQKYPRITNLPALYITLDDGKQVSDIEHGVYTSAKYTFVSDYIEDSYYDQTLQIKGRGNYSWSFYQKPYTLKLDQKADLAGMGAAKKWVLITVSSDRTMMRNYMTQKLAKEVGLPGTCDNEYVDVLVNGEYLGTYVLTEKIQIHENRIDVPEEQAVLFEIEMVYRHSCDCCVLLYENKSNPSNSVHLEVKHYLGKDLSKMRADEKKKIAKRLQSYFDVIAEAMQKGDYATLQRYLDIDSFINWYLVNEITRNYDSAFVTSCYCFMDEHNVLHMGPCWDYDTCYGAQFPDYDVARIREAIWYTWMFDNCKEFSDAVEARWTELRDTGVIDRFVSNIDVIRKQIEQSEKLEHAKYPRSEVREYASYDEAVEYLKEWLGKRIEWMDTLYYRKSKE